MTIITTLNGTSSLNEVLDKILRLTTEITRTNAVSVLSYIEEIKNCVAGTLPYSGHLYFCNDGVHMICRGSNTRTIPPTCFIEVWKIDLAFVESGTPILSLTQEQSRRCSPRDRFFQMLQMAQNYG